MFWLGKLLGGLFGYMLAGPLGAMFGLILGHFFDISRKSHWFLFPPPKHTHTQEIFFQATFIIMGYIAKSDGRVSENEIQVAKRIMQNMLLTPSLRQQAIQYFQQGKQANFNLDSILASLSHACAGQENLLNIFLDLQLQAACADGIFPHNKRKILEFICYRLRVNPSDLFQRAYRYTYNQRQQGYQQGQNRQYQSYQQPTKTNTLEAAYRLLGVNQATNNIDLKKAYRKLMSKNHPDKLVSKGLPEEMIRIATQKTQEIKLAYETICKARGI